MIATPPKARPFFQSMFTDRVVSAVAQPRVNRDPVQCAGQTVPDSNLFADRARGA